MIMTTTEAIPGRSVEQVFGLVRGATIRAKHIGKDVIAAMRNLTGGEIVEYTRMLAIAREEALDRLQEEARAMGANAVIGIRFQTSTVMRGAAELLCYGTAVRLSEPDA